MLPVEQLPILFSSAPQSLFYLLDFRNRCVCLTQLHCIDSNAQLLKVTQFNNAWEGGALRSARNPECSPGGAEQRFFLWPATSANFIRCHRCETHLNQPTDRLSRRLRSDNKLSAQTERMITSSL